LWVFQRAIEHACNPPDPDGNRDVARLNSSARRDEKLEWRRQSVRLFARGTAHNMRESVIMNDSLLVAAPLMIGAIVMAVRFVGCGLAGPTGGNGVVVSVTGDVSGRGGLSATVSFPENKPLTQGYTVAGTYTFEIPYWCAAIDLILLGAGGGGTYGGINNGVGGAAGSWKTATLERGPDIPWATTTISIVVGQGGAPGAVTGTPAMAGGDTTASWDSSPGPTTETASGGGAGASSSGQVGDGPNPGLQSIGDATLTAGTAQPAAGATGNAPGGGGAGSDVISEGGAGADGAAVLVARQQK
jgi:hypothetical protein